MTRPNPLPAANSRLPFHLGWLREIRCSLAPWGDGSPAAVAEGGRSAPAKLQRSARFIENVLSENRSEPQRDDTSPFSPPHAAPLGLKRVQKRARYYKQDAPLELASRPFNPVGLARRVRPNSAASLGGGSPVLLTILAHRPPASEHASWATFTPKKWNTR